MTEVVALQGFISASPWLAFDVFREIQAVFAEELLPTVKQWSLGTVGVIDESGFVKAGTQSVGVASQWRGRLGKTQNCDSGDFLDALEAMPQRYLVAVRKTTLVWTVDPATLPGSTPRSKRGKKRGSYRDAHRKTWLRKHKRIKPEVLL